MFGVGRARECACSAWEEPLTPVAQTDLLRAISAAAVSWLKISACGFISRFVVMF